LTFLKNAMGDGVHFCIEKGGSARANLLSQQHSNLQRKKRKLLDAAATRVGTTVTLLDQKDNDERKIREQHEQEERNRRERETQQGENSGDNNNDNGDEENKKKEQNGSGSANDKNTIKDSNGRILRGTTGMDWLNDNISREDLDREMEKLRQQDREQEELLLAATAEENDQSYNARSNYIFLSDYIDPALQAPSLWDEHKRKVTFQSLYKKEIGRQANLLQLPEYNETAGNFSSPPKGLMLSSNDSVVDDRSITWEDG